jgi:hypothetical protein
MQKCHEILCWKQLWNSASGVRWQGRIGKLEDTITLHFETGKKKKKK